MMETFEIIKHNRNDKDKDDLKKIVIATLRKMEKKDKFKIPYAVSYHWARDIRAWAKEIGMRVRVVYEWPPKISEEKNGNALFTVTVLEDGKN